MKSAPLNLLLSLFLSFPVLAESRIQEVRKRTGPVIQKELSDAGLKLGNKCYLQVFKMERQMELWMQKGDGEQYQLFKTYPIAGMSGQLGPKLQEGDYQAPEGFYKIVKGNLNPNSRFHLSFNIGYPNKYDRAHKRTGSYIMVHGSNVSVGCYAMTDPKIEEIYLIVESALNNGQPSVPFHSYPYQLRKRLLAPGHDKWGQFWQQELAPAYFQFLKTKRPPRISVEGAQYVVK